jgi:hypothetical protein
MRWAAVVACVSVFGALLASRRLFRELPVATSYLLPPVLLCVGALDWSLWSGMEVALLLGLWSLAIVAWDDLRRASGQVGARYGEAALLGATGLLLCATRPESIGALGVLVVTALWDYRREKPTRLLSMAGLALVPALGLLVGHAFANHALTGDSTAAGALVKLEMHHPLTDRKSRLLPPTPGLPARRFSSMMEERREPVSDDFDIPSGPAAEAQSGL